MKSWRKRGKRESHRLRKSAKRGKEEAVVVTEKL
jgi:hypothetical protein